MAAINSTTNTRSTTPASSAALAQQRMATLKKMLEEYFPEFNNSVSENLRYYILGIWTLETGLGTNLGTPDSVFTDTYTIRNNASSTWQRVFGNAYQGPRPSINAYSSFDVVTNLRRTLGDKVVIDSGITKAHGIGQVMGGYHIPGIDTTIINPKDPFKTKIVTEFGLDATQGNANLARSIADIIYGSSYNGKSGLERGMASSIMVLRDKWIKSGRNMERAIQNYFGSGTDIFQRYTPAEYLAQVKIYANKALEGNLKVASNNNTSRTKKVSGGGDKGAPIPSTTNSNTASSGVFVPGCDQA